MPRLNRLLLMPWLAVIAGQASAHGEADWNDFKIDNKNEQVELGVQQVRDQIADVVLGRRQVQGWPDAELVRTRDKLVHLAEEVDAMLQHFREDGILIQFSESLREHPRAGRAVAGSHAIEVAIALLDRMAASAGPEVFEEELHEGGTGAWMFDLMDAYAEMMWLYAQLQPDADTN